MTHDDPEIRERRLEVLQLREFYNRLHAHDWSYMYSEDIDIERRGSQSHSRLNAEAHKSPARKELYEAWQSYGTWSRDDGIPCPPKPPFPLRYLCDNARHMICEPFSLENLHRMASSLGIKRAWFHTGKFPHYDMPKKRIEELTAQCEVMTQKDILRIIKAGAIYG